jgi:lipid II:glycine glycyltransferase (peptidoglycan interpeptide bridge formation enzyme)
VEFRALTEADRPAYERLHTAAPMATAYSDWDWQGILRHHGWQTRPVGVVQGGEMLAAAIVATRVVPVIGWSVVDLHRSLFGTSAEALRLLLREVLAQAERERSVRVRFAVQFPAAEMERQVGGTLASLLPRPPDRTLALEEHGTYWLTLDAAESWGPASWNEHNRRNLRKGERAGMEVHERNTPKGIDQFHELHTATHGRKEIVPKSRRFFDALEPLLRRGRMVIFLAEHGGKPIAACVLGLGRVARYLWGGTAQGGTEIAGSGPLLHLAMMRRAAASGADVYDLGGSPGPEPDPSHPNYGVWRFKAGFRGRFVRNEEDYDYVLRPAAERWLSAIARRLPT